MAMSNAERQKQYRERMKAKGKMRIVQWAEKGGGLAVSDEKNLWATMTKAQLDGEILKALNVFDGEYKYYREIVCAEIAAHLPGIVKRFKRYSEIDTLRSNKKQPGRKKARKTAPGARGV